MDVVIVGATVWPGTTATSGMLTNVTIGIDDGQIVHVGSEEGLPTEPAVEITGHDLFVTPGLVDAHAHTGLSLARGLAQDVPETEWMDRALGPIAQVMETEDYRFGSRVGVLEAIRSGVTTMCEYGHEVRELIESVHQPAGLRTVAVETINEVTARPDDGPYELDTSASADARARTRELFSWADETPRVSAMYGPQSLDMVTRETLEEIVARANEHDRRIHLHLAQGGRERNQLEARYNEGSAVKLLDMFDCLSDRILGAHLHGATAEERNRLIDAGVAMVGCPSSIGGIDGVIPPVASYQQNGGTVGLGTDQAPGGGGGHALLQEVRQASLFGKIELSDPSAMPAWKALYAGTHGGAKALGIDDQVGSIEVGKRADIACFDMTELPVSPSSIAAGGVPLANLVLGGARSSVVHLLVDGTFIVRHGQIRTLDAAAVVTTASERMDALHARARQNWLDGGSTLARESQTGAFSVRHIDQ